MSVVYDINQRKLLIIETGWTYKCNVYTSNKLCGYYVCI